MPKSFRPSIFAVVVAALILPLDGFSSQDASSKVSSGETENSERSTHAESSASLRPAIRYSGNTPIELCHGGLGNNGTYGARNPEYEAMAQAELLAPGVMAGPYPFDRKSQLISGLKDRLQFFEEAILNLEERSSTTREEAVQYADQALPQIRNLLTQARSAWKKAKGAGPKEWLAAQNEARQAFFALYGTYRGFTTTASH